MQQFFSRQSPHFIEILKWIAILTMTIDHAGLILYEDNVFLRAIGRLSFPIFAYILVHNYLFFTSNKPRYIGRLTVFAILSQPAFSLAIGDRMNIFVLLSMSLFSIYIIEYIWRDQERTKPIKYVATSMLIFLGTILSTAGEYPVYGYIFILSLYGVFLGKAYAAPIAAISLILTVVGEPIHMVAVLFVPFVFAALLLFETVIPRMNKWFFYLYYPGHLLLLFQIARYANGELS